jgi:hypothetical protein
VTAGYSSYSGTPDFLVGLPSYESLEDGLEEEEVMRPGMVGEA